MFSILDGINSALSGIALEAKTKGRLYVILSFFGEIYLAYVTYRFLANGKFVRGLLLLAVTIILAYFLYLNAIYYFTTKTSKFDITPWIYKVLHINPKEDDGDSTAKSRNVKNIASNGLFDDMKTMPAQLTTDKDEQAYTNDLANRLIDNKLVETDYDGKTDRQIARQLKHRNKPIYAIGAGSVLPYFSMKQENGKYVIYAGLNAAECQPVGELKTVGLQDVNNLSDDIHLYLANAYLVGGPNKTMGRDSVMTNQGNYQIAVQIAYKRDKPSDK